MQQRIINRVEGDPHYSAYLQSTRPKITDGTSTSAIILAARQIARNVNAKCIASFTVGGNTARMASMKRPDQPILAISPLKATCRHLAMSWGVYPEHCPEDRMNVDNFRDMLWVACDIGKKKGLVSEDTDLLVVTAGFPFGTPGAANIIRVIPGKVYGTQLNSVFRHFVLTPLTYSCSISCFLLRSRWTNVLGCQTVKRVVHNI